MVPDLWLHKAKSLIPQIKYCFIFCLFGWLCSPDLLAQTAPWVYAGGEKLNDQVTDIAVQYDDYEHTYSCIRSETDSISFRVVCLDKTGNLIWETILNKNEFLEVPNSITVNIDNTIVRVIGYANSTLNLWAVDLSATTGEIIETSAAWSDLTEDSSGVSAYVGPDDTTNFNMFTYEAGTLSCYESWDLAFIGGLETYSFPTTDNNRDLILSDCEMLLNGFNTIVGNFGPELNPYVWVFNGIDSLYFDTPVNDTVLFNAVSPKDSGFVVAGNTLDSSGLYFSTWNFLGGVNFEPDLVKYYTEPGYPVVGKDIVRNFDHTFYYLSVHYDPTGTRTVLMHLDETGEIISETTLFPEEKTVELSHMTRQFLSEDAPYIMGGFIQTETPGKENEFLICSTDTIPVWPGCVYDCVWPGDANNDGNVDMTDLFPIGAFCYYHGPVRDSVSIYWIGDVAEEWIYSYGDLNAKYGNCDGDTMIFYPDTSAIVANYSDTHAVFTLKNNGGDIPIWLNTTGIILMPGYNEIPIMLGTEEIPVDSIYGLEFSISYEGLPVIDSTSMRVNFYDSWLGDDAEFIQLDTAFANIHLIDAGVVNTFHANHSGYGEIGKFSFVVEDNIAGIMIASGDSTIIFNISGPTAVLNDLSEVSISGSACEVLVSTEVKNELPENNLMIFPNPWHGELLSIYPEDLIKNNFHFELIAIDGSMIETGILNSNIISINNKISSGEYILKITGDEHVYQFKLIHL